MTYATDSFDTLPKMPSWVTSARAETPEDVAFLSGAALSHLNIVLQALNLPESLLRARLALRAAEVCVSHQGRPERAGALRDAVTFLQPGDSPGPAGAVYLAWQRVVERPISVKALHRSLPRLAPEQISTWLVSGQGGPVAQASAVFERVRGDGTRVESAAVILADVVLSQALGWRHVLPLLSLGLKRGDLQKTGDDLRLACHRAVIVGGEEAHRVAADLVRRADHLRDIVPKLRAKGAEVAVAEFLSRDAVAPSLLTSLRSDRAARRFCDRMVELGAVRELTGRDSFRLYGI